MEEINTKKIIFLSNVVSEKKNKTKNIKKMGGLLEKDRKEPFSDGTSNSQEGWPKGNSTISILEKTTEENYRKVTEHPKWSFEETNFLFEYQLSILEKLKIYIQTRNTPENETDFTEGTYITSEECSGLQDSVTDTATGATISDLHIVADSTSVTNHISIFLQEINKKISGYKHQDVLKHIFNKRVFVDILYIINILILCNLDCYYCKEKVNVIYQQVRDPKQWSLERIDNTFGHNKGNTVIACLYCNLRRRTMYHERYVFTKQLKLVKKIDTPP